MDDRVLKEELRGRARQVGFSDARVAGAIAPAEDVHRLREWLGAGMHGEMAYMERHGLRRGEADTVLQGAVSVIVLAADYDPCLQSDASAHGAVRVARYAVGKDYHDVLKERAAGLVEWLASVRPGHEWRVVTDSAPVLERAYAVAAGIGFAAKNSMVIAPARGSYFFLAEIVSTALIEPDSPVEGTCGSCRRCIDACPTDAIVEPHRVDARRCISYLTIEKRSDLTADEEAALHGWVFGCDICQEVCPYNKFAGPTPFEEFREGRVVRSVEPVSTFVEPASNSQFERRFAGSAILRPGRRRVARNALAAAKTVSPDKVRGDER